VKAKGDGNPLSGGWYTYDELNRLVTASDGVRTTGYTYDTAGNLTAEALGNQTTTYQYNALNQQVSVTDKKNVDTKAYDRRGNLVQTVSWNGKTLSNTWDATNHLAAGQDAQGDVSAYTFNALFQRVNLTQTSHAGQVYSRDYVNDLVADPRDELMVFAADYTQTRAYAAAGGGLVAQSTLGSNGQDRLLYALEDLRGSTVSYTRPGGQTTERVSFDPWGVITSTGKLVNNDHGSHITASFTGHEYDTTLDVYHGQARLYDPAAHAWWSIDPAHDGINWYQYSASNPTTFNDPTGQWPQIVIGALIGAAISIGTQVVSDIVSGHASSWETYVGAAVGGAASGAVMAATGSMAAAGAAGAAAQTFTTGALEIASGKRPNTGEAWGSLIRDTGKNAAIGAVSGAIGGGVFKGTTAGINALAGKLGPGATALLGTTGGRVVSTTIAGFASATVGGFAGAYFQTGSIACAFKNTFTPGSMFTTLLSAAGGSLAGPRPKVPTTGQTPAGSATTVNAKGQPVYQDAQGSWRVASGPGKGQYSSPPPGQAVSTRETSGSSSPKYTPEQLADMAARIKDAGDTSPPYGPMQVIAVGANRDGTLVVAAKNTGSTWWTKEQNNVMAEMGVERAPTKRVPGVKVHAEDNLLNALPDTTGVGTSRMTPCPVCKATLERLEIPWATKQ
jgi:RHS repeat-associated protein